MFGKFLLGKQYVSLFSEMYFTDLRFCFVSIEYLYTKAINLSKQILNVLFPYPQCFAKMAFALMYHVAFMNGRDP